MTPVGGNIRRCEGGRPQKLAGYGLNVDASARLANINVSQRRRISDGPELDYTMNANDQIQDPRII